MVQFSSGFRSSFVEVLFQMEHKKTAVLTYFF
jgi:hypothetical protein